MSWLVLGLLVVGALIWARDFLEGERLLLDLYREWQLSRTDLFELDAACAANTDRSDIVVSLSVIPSRIGFVAFTLKSLMSQTRAPAEIRIYVPSFSIREQVPYVVPDWLSRLKSVRIVSCGTDYGPATKLIPALLASEADQKIVALDDDRIYPRKLIAILESAARSDADAAFGFSGWIVPEDFVDRPTTIVGNVLERAPVPIRATRQRTLREVDILQGVGAFLVRPPFFDLTQLLDYSAAPQAAFFVDDVWISAHCSVPKYVVPARRSNFQPRSHALFFKRTSLGWINRGPGGHTNRNNSIMLRYFSDRWRVGGPRSGRKPR